MTETFWGEFDLASLTLWLFWFFFAALVIYIQRENMREGYPLEDDEGRSSSNPGLFPLPDDKTFKLPHGRGVKKVPRDQNPERSEIAVRKAQRANGYPLEPTGDPMIDGIGPAAWAERRNEPELDGHGHNKLVPMSLKKDFMVSAGRDPCGFPVISGDGEKVGEVVDLWIDVPEQLVRYFEFKLDDRCGGGTRLVPTTQARIWDGRLRIYSIFAAQFENIPTHASRSQVTLLEEDKISAYYGGGNLYAHVSRQEPQVG